MNETTAYGLIGPDGKAMTALFTGERALEAALLWAAHLHAQREVLARRGAEWRRDKQRKAWRSRRGEDRATEVRDDGS